jgi:hypothetical protein
MVRAAFEGDGASFPSTAASFRVVHSMAGGTNGGADGNRDKSSSDEAALSARLGSLDHRLSEIQDSRKIGTGQSGSEQDAALAKASAMAMGFRLSSELRPCRGGSWLGFRSLAVDFALGPYRILAAWLYRGRDQCDAGGGRDGEAV